MNTPAVPRQREALRPFAVTVVPDRDRVILAPVGELDMATADQLWDELQELRTAGFDRVVLDLRELTFMDSTALRLIVRARDASLRDGFDFALIDGAEPVCRVLDITGLRDHLTFTRP